MEEDHVHCLSCVNQRCMVRREPGISCDIITCPLECGAIFHACKVDEHLLLCPQERVSCLNSGYGCPVTLLHSQMSAHLEVCPAGVVCCTMEWNRWPVGCLDYSSYESLSRGEEEVEQLDIALALQDQRTLLESLKVFAMAPTAGQDPLVGVSKESGAVVSAVTDPDGCIIIASPSSRPPQPHLPCSAKERIASGINGLNEEHFGKLYEATVETARTLAAALDFVSGAGSSDSSTEDGRLQTELEDKTPVATNGFHTRMMNAQSICYSCGSDSRAQTETDVKSLISRNGLLSEAVDGCLAMSEWQDDTSTDVSQEPVTSLTPMHVSRGVAQRAGHVVLEDRGPLVLENQDFEWKIQNCQMLRGEKKHLVPCEQDRPVNGLRPEMEDKAVDTSDLEQKVDPAGLGEMDLITAALLFCLDESREFRRISDTVYVDGHRVDFGTQTFSFPAAMLVTSTRVGDMASASACDRAVSQIPYPSPFRTLRLGLVLEVPHKFLPSNLRYQEMFPFVCGQSFRRDQFSSHFSNVHSDIHAGLNGWMEHRCPLAYYGCTFSQRRFYPSTEGAKVVHDRHLRSFGVQPCPKARLQSDFQSDQFSGLPAEILRHIAGFLDSFSLCQLSMVSRTMREVCASLLQTRGIVELQWERKQNPSNAYGTVSWQIKDRVWRFSTAFSPVSSWGYTNLPSMSNHLKKCPFNEVEHKTEPVPVPAMCISQDGHALRHVLRHINT